MTEKRKVPIKNILYMFSYIWDQVNLLDNILKNNDDDFDSPDIVVKLFLENIKDMLKIGLYREYQEVNEEIRSIKGKIDFKESLNNLSLQNAKAFCIYDEFTEDNIINQIIKTTAYKLYKLDKIEKDYQRELNNILLYFNKVQLINIDKTTFDIKFNRNNYYTKLVILICKLIYEITMLSENSGKYKFIDIQDDDKTMAKLYELFIYSFYKKELKNIYSVTKQKTLNWSLKGDNKDIIPKMYVDTFLNSKKNNKTIIIDTKYYPDYLTTKNKNEDKKKLINDNLFQMFSYMSNVNTNHELVGMLLYPMPYNEKEISEKYQVDIINNGTIKKAILQIQTVNLNNDWQDIKKELLSIIK